MFTIKAQELRQEVSSSPLDIVKRVPRPLLSRAVQEIQALTSEGVLSDHAKVVAAPLVQREVPIPVCPVVNINDSKRLPAVVSVKKSHRGCAVVILRDRQIIERCALQQVAVIDGVCVEMKRHSKKSRTEDDVVEQAEGIFCAWGNRVERKVPVSEEGIEEFFNSLAGVPCPDGLVASPPFEEAHLCFPLKSNNFATLSFDVRIDCPDTEKLLSSSHCDRTLIRALWQAKGRVDELWNRPPPPMARSVISRVARAQLFPHSGVGGEDHENRAGDKLAQLSDVVGLLDGVPHGSAFLDLCGGPGAWSQHLLGHTELKLRGFGLTLKAGSGSDGDWQAAAKDEWYQDLYDHPDWTAIWGQDGTGDLLKPCNLEHAARALANQDVFLCVADGGFSDDAIPANQLELYFYRLFLAELLLAVSCLGPGGKFVCKLYTTFSEASSALLFLTTRMFDSVNIVKPMSSRATGPERYLSAVGFHGDDICQLIRSALLRAHSVAGAESPLTTPLLTPLVYAEVMLQDESFTSSMREMVTRMCERQTLALNAVVDRADFLEDMAMACATCVDPFTRLAPAKDEGLYRNERRDGKGNGKGKGKGGRNNFASSRRDSQACYQR